MQISFIIDICGVLVLLNDLHKSFSDSGAKTTQIAHAPKKKLSVGAVHS